MIAIHNSMNCNFQYVTGLSTYRLNMRKALRDILTGAVVPYYGFGNPPKAKIPVHRKPQGGMYIFAQGSEDSIKTRPYGPKLKSLIEELKLGTVLETGLVPNPLHQYKPGMLF